jgi:hypothetical protein
MSFTVLEPEVAGGWGPHTIADVSVHPPRVERLHYELDGWLGDDFLASFPCFVVTERLACELKLSGLTGFTLDHVEVSVSSEFRDLHPKSELPVFRWLRVTGRPGLDDFGIAGDHRLVASCDAMALLERFTLDHADATPWRGWAG